MISNCGHDENNRYSGGAAGDQTGTEWALISWYNRPWSCVLRHPDAKVRALLAEMATAAAKNNAIGYDQSERYTFWENLKASNYDPAKITVKCEADCSSGVAAIVKGAGYRLGIQKLKDVSIYCYTGNLRAALKAAGFEVLTDSKYLTSDAYLLAGDILLNDSCHTATNVTDGSKASGTTSSGTTASSGASSTVKVESAKSKDNSLAGTYKVTASDYLALRAGAGTGKTLLAKMKPNETVQCYGYYTTVSGVKWLYVVYNGQTGFASSEYLKKQTASSSGASSTVKVESAKSKDNSLAGTYKVTASDYLALRAGAGTGKTLLAKMKPNEKVQCYGYYTTVSGVKWLYVTYNGQTGFASSNYLKKQ